MEATASSSGRRRDSPLKADGDNSRDNTTDSDWSDIDDSDVDDGNKSLRIDLREEDDAELSTPTTSAKLATKSPARRPSSSRKRSGKLLLRSRSKARQKRRMQSLKKIDVPEEVGKNAEGFEKGMEAVASKLHMNRTQVKSVIRKLVEAPELLRHVQEMAGDKTNSDNKDRSDLKMTRTVAKNVAESGGKLDWFLEKVNQKEATPVKKPKRRRKNDLTTQVLLQDTEMPDEEDEEYDPSKDPSANSDEESNYSVQSESATTPRAGLESPTSSVTSSASIMTPQTGSGTKTRTTRSSAGKQFTTPAASTSSEFKRPDAPSVVRTLDFGSSVLAGDGGSVLSAAEQEAKQLRSRVSLKEVSIEELEAQFQPPDLTPDLYEPDDDVDWIAFLTDNYYKPKPDQVEPEKMVEEEETGDPDYVYDEQEELFDLPDEYTYNRRTKVPLKEKHDLLDELIQDYNLNESAIEASRQNGKRSSTGSKRRSESGLQNLHQESEHQLQFEVQEQPQEEEYPTLTYEQKLLVGQQMRQHIQLTTQMALLTSKSDDPQFTDSHLQCRSILSEIMTKSFCVQYSMFAQDNLFSSIKLVDDWNSNSMSVTQGKGLSPSLMDLMGNSTAFIYPSLLPASAMKKDFKFNNKTKSERVYFAEGEDELIAKGLEDYFDDPESGIKHKLKSACKHLCSTVLTGKTFAQVRTRIKNQKLRFKSKQADNPISYYLDNHVAKRDTFDTLKTYEASDVVAPRYANPDELPENFKDHFQINSGSKTKPVPATTDSTPKILGKKPVQKRNKKKSESADQPVVSVPIVQGPAPSVQNIALVFNPNGVGVPTFVVQQEQQPLAQQIVIQPAVVEPEQSAGQDQDGNPGASSNTADLLDAAMEECGIAQDMPDFDLNSPRKSPAKNPTPISTPRKSPLTTPAVEDQVVDNPESDEALETMDVEEAAPPEEPPAVVKSPQPAAAQQQQQQKPTRKTKVQKEAEQTLQLLEAEKPDEESLRKEREAMEIIMTAKETLSPADLKTFFSILLNKSLTNVAKFTAMHNVCRGYHIMQELLLDLLTASEAMQLGLGVYDQFCTRVAMKRFYRKLKLYYKNQPGTHTKILKDLQACLHEPDVPIEDLKALGTKLLKGNAYLLEEFLHFVSQVPYPEGQVPVEAEVVDLNSDEEADGNGQVENVQMPDDPNDELGGDNCPCSCHPAPNTGHCIHCSIKFINGKAYTRDGKCLRPVTITYPKGQNPFSNPKSDKKKSRKRKRV